MWTSRSRAKSQRNPPQSSPAGSSANEKDGLVLDSIVSESSRMIAAQRALEAQMAFPLANDHLAATLAGDQAIEAARRNFQERGTDLTSPRIAIRTRYFDDKVLQWTDPDNAEQLYALGTPEEMKTYAGQLFSCSQVVILGSGMDSRAWRLPWSENVSVYEVDRRDVVEYKKAVLAKSREENKEKQLELRCRSHTSVIADVSNAEEVSKGLLRAGFKPQQSSIFIAEGLLYYLQADDITFLLKRLSQICKAPSVFLASILSADAVLGAEQPSKPSKLSQEWKFGLNYDDADTFFSNAGWKILTKHKIGEPLANYGRWIKPQTDRLYYVTAIV